MKVSKDPRVALKYLSAGKITSTYNGAQGCACGCRGTHSTDPKLNKRRVNAMMKLIQQGVPCESTNSYIAVDHGNRLWIAYPRARPRLQHQG